MISCGEASGDLYAGALAAELRARVPSIDIVGLGGPRLREAGAALAAARHVGGGRVAEDEVVGGVVADGPQVGPAGARRAQAVAVGADRLRLGGAAVHGDALGVDGEEGVEEEVDLRVGSSDPARSIRDVAQPGSAPDWGSGGRGFESRHPDQTPSCGRR